MVKDAFYFIIPLAALAVAAYLFDFLVLAGILMALAAFVAFFFRNPDRTITDDPTAIVSPADGKVIIVEPGEEGTQLSIFLSVFDVHVNRAPIAGVVRSVVHHSGQFRLAWDERASVDNERVVIKIDGEHSLTLALVAGLVARRIIPWKKEGETVRIGERLALIRFGSRVDMLIPKSAEVRVKKGDRVRAGSTVLANWRQRL
ncbi:MAG: phosphatidylserine decarboxylase [Acidobacteriota bacterium]|nr:MAG: phosphatidylserine decarboxylase [Acidobacteriota bacterium]